MSSRISSKQVLTAIVVVLTMFQSVGGLVALASSTSGTSSRIAETGYWTDLSPLNGARYDHTMQIFDDDSILVIGGQDGTKALNSVELYSPLVGSWVNVTKMHTARWGHASVTLINKTVLVIGGYGTGGSLLKSVELFNLSKNAWYNLSNMPFASGGANLSAIVLTNGSVLVVGGNAGPANAPNIQAMAAIYDTTNNSWSNIALPSVAAMGRQTFMLLNSTILTVGGSVGSPWFNGTKATELFIPATKKWIHIGDLGTARYMFDGVPLGNGKVLVTGGIRQFWSGKPNNVGFTEVFNTSSSAWETGPALIDARFGHTTTLLPDAEVLVAGGQNDTMFFNSTEIIEVNQGKTVKGPPMHNARARQTAGMNNHGFVIVTGGLNAGGATGKVELFKAGVKQAIMKLDLTGLTYVQSQGRLTVKAHVHNDTTGDLLGTIVTFRSGGLGSFDSDAGMTDIAGVYTTTFNAPRNTGAHPFTVTITVKADMWGYKEASAVLGVNVHPETRGEPMRFNQSIDHLAYVTTYSSGSEYTEASNLHSGLDLLGDEKVSIDGQPVVAANFSTWEKADKTMVTMDMTQHQTSELKGHYYFEYDIQGVVYAYTNRTTRTYIHNDTFQRWNNITEIAEIRYLPVMRDFNASIIQIGKVQDVINTFQITTTTLNLDTKAMSKATMLRTEPKSYLYTGMKNVTTFMGGFQARNFIDETGMVYDSYSPDLGILLEEVVFNMTGHLASTKALLEFNDQVREDPTSPLLTVTLHVDHPTLEASTSTKMQAVVTSGSSPVQGVTVTATAGNGGSLVPAQGITDQYGYLNFTFDADKGSITRNIDLMVIVNKTGYRTNNAKATVTVVQDLKAPVVTYTPITDTEEAKALQVYAMVSDDVGVKEVMLYYRIGDIGDFIAVPMGPFLGAYTATIPASAVTPHTLQYYITASDVNGNMAVVPSGAPDDPYTVNVAPRLRVLPPMSVILDPGEHVTVIAAIRGNLSLIITKANDPDTGPADNRFLGLYASVTAIGPGQLVWANISFSYNHYMLGYLKEDELRIYWWDPTGRTWMSTTNTGVQTGPNIIWANVTHLSIFAPRTLSTPVIPPNLDKTLPTVSLVFPTKGAILKQGIVQISGTASDNIGLYSVEVSLDYGIWIDVWVPPGSKVASWYFNTTLLPGDHYIFVRSRDMSGNIGNETSIVVTVKEPTSPVSVTSRAILTAAAALLVVIFAVLLLFIVSTASEQEKRPARAPKEEEDIEEDDEEVGEEE